jgi:membrane peptidoglycan carboxypeptidase
LLPHELALLIALVKGPSYYDPRRHPKRAKERRDLMLDEFASARLMTKEEAEAAKKLPYGVSCGDTTRKTISLPRDFGSFPHWIRACNPRPRKT